MQNEELLKSFDINKIILKTDLYDLSNYNLKYKKTFLNKKIMLTFIKKGDPDSYAQFNILVSHRGQIDYENFEVTFTNITTKDEYWTKSLHNTEGPARIVYKNNMPVIVTYAVNGYMLYGTSFKNLLDDCKKDQLKLYDNLSEIGLNIAESMSKYYNANNLYESIQAIKLLNELEGKDNRGDLKHFKDLAVKETFRW